MRTAVRDSGKDSLLNCGLWRERGTVRTSTRYLTSCAFNNSMKDSRDRVEWPTVSPMSGSAGVRLAIAGQD
jgi:hypothetical protein